MMTTRAFFWQVILLNWCCVSFSNRSSRIKEARLPAVQMGAVSKRGTDLVTHMLTSFIESRTRDNDGVGVCFVDLVNAFDREL